MAVTRPLRLLFAEVYAAEDVSTWSGTPVRMVESLRRAGVDVVIADGLMPPWSRGLEAARRVVRTVGAPTWLWEREPAVLRAHAARVHAAAEAAGADVILAPGALPVAALPPGRPVVIWADATFAALVDYYDEYTGLSKRSLRVGDLAERQALSRAELVVLSSQWAADSALHDYAVDASRVAVVPFGARVPVDAAETARLTESRAQAPVRLLLVGVDWYRKGVPVAVDAVSLLADSGVEVHLDVVGCRAPLGMRLPPNVVVHGFLRTDVAAERIRLDALFRQATLLVVPSQAECFGLVYAEAAGWGLPSVAARTGGVPTVVIDGLTGRLVPAPPEAQHVAAAILELTADPVTYTRAGAAARAHFESQLTWTHAVDHLLRRVDAMLGRRAS